MSPYTKLAVRSLGPTKAVTLEQHRDIPTYVPNSPTRGTRKHSTDPKPTDDGRWWEQGPCARQGHDSIWMQPSKFPKAEVHAAAALCARCPVKKQCSEQPYPHVGITAGKIHWDGARYAEEVKLCEQCLEPTSRKSRFCSQKCKDRWYYVVRVQEGEQPVGPLMAWFKNRPVTHIARECGVAVRTVYRWDEAGAIPGGSVRQIVNRLNVRIEDIWPTSNVRDIRTGVRSEATITNAAPNGEETGSVGTAPAPSKEPSDVTGGPLVSIVRHLPAPVKLSQG